MRAEDLDFAPVITWWNNRNMWKEKAIPEPVVRRFDGHRIYTVMAGEDEREGGALLYFGLKSPLDIETDDREFPSPMQFVEQARKRNPEGLDRYRKAVLVGRARLAGERSNELHRHCQQSHVPQSDVRERGLGQAARCERLPEPRGNGFWTQEIYYHMLNSGLRLPPSAGSASGVLPNPVGYNRVYVHLDEPFTCDAWFRGLSRGRCFVTNGPLLLVTADGQDPGAIIKLQSGESRTVRINIQLTSQDPISPARIDQERKCSPTPSNVPTS